jgi:hypothetical protein
VDRIEHYLNSVINHLTARGTLKPTLTKFRYLGLKTAVRRLLNSGFSDAVDFQTCFETPRDFDDIQSWLESLQLEYEGRIPRDYSIEERLKFTATWAFRQVFSPVKNSRVHFNLDSLLGETQNLHSCLHNRESRFRFVTCCLSYSLIHKFRKFTYGFL